MAGEDAQGWNTHGVESKKSMTGGSRKRVSRAANRKNNCEGKERKHKEREREKAKQNQKKRNNVHAGGTKQPGGNGKEKTEDRLQMRKQGGPTMWEVNPTNSFCHGGVGCGWGGGRGLNDYDNESHKKEVSRRSKAVKKTVRSAASWVLGEKKRLGGSGVGGRQEGSRN